MNDDQEWEVISRDRLMKKDPRGFNVIVPSDRPDLTRVPWDCPICELIMRDSDDPNYFRLYNCCGDCAATWAEPDRARWSTGWRPSPEVVATRVKLRSSLPTNIKI